LNKEQMQSIADREKRIRELESELRYRKKEERRVESAATCFPQKTGCVGKSEDCERTL